MSKVLLGTSWGTSKLYVSTTAVASYFILMSTYRVFQPPLSSLASFDGTRAPTQAVVWYTPKPHDLVVFDLCPAPLGQVTAIIIS